LAIGKSQWESTHHGNAATTENLADG